MKFAVERKGWVRFEIAFCLAIAMLITACGSSSKSNSSSSSSGISGNWQMSLQPSNANWKPSSQSGFLMDNNGTLTGGMAFQDTACPGVGNVSGSVNGSNLTFTVNPAGVDIEYTGSLTQSNTMAGSYTILSTGCSGTYSAPQTGTWTANQVSTLNVTLQGTFISSHKNAPATYTITGKLTQGSNTGASSASVSGTISTTGYCFFTTANVAGTISGTSVVLNLVASDGVTQLGQVAGTTSLDGTTFSGTYRMIGLGPGNTPPCVNGDTGTVTWQSGS